jgi:uncharacterized protein (UPF0297 family)
LKISVEISTICVSDSVNAQQRLANGRQIFVSHSSLFVIRRKVSALFMQGRTNFSRTGSAARKTHIHPRNNPASSKNASNFHQTGLLFSRLCGILISQTTATWALEVIMSDKTRIVDVRNENNLAMRQTLQAVYAALEERGYDPLGQISGYILSEDPTYITTHKNARALAQKLDRDELLGAMLRGYLGLS